MITANIINVILMWDGKLKEDVDRMRKMSVFKKIQNITLEEYLTLLEQMKQAALSDMDSFPEKEKYMGDVQPGSFLGVRLGLSVCRLFLSGTTAFCETASVSLAIYGGRVGRTAG